MLTLIAEIPEQSVPDALTALSPFVKPGAVKLCKVVPPPSGDDNAELTKLAAKVVAAIRPKPSQPLRKEALKALLWSHCTFVDGHGEADPALRNAMGAISKALKSVFMHDAPVRRLAVPKKTKFEDGSYRGTQYLLTPLGERVRDLLLAEKAI